jgi:hypothetical protein
LKISMTVTAGRLLCNCIVVAKKSSGGSNWLIEWLSVAVDDLVARAGRE